MNRLEKKCFATVASAHGLLLVILFVGPAFFVSSEKSNPSADITVYDPGKVSLALTHGGTPQDVRPLPSPPAAAVQQQQPVVQPKPPEIPPQPKSQPKTAPKEIDIKEPVVKTTHGDEPPPKKTKRTTTLSADDLTPTKTDRDAQKKEAEAAKARARAAAAAAAKEQADEVRRIGSTIRSLKSNLSGKTAVTIEDPGEGGGPASVNYFQLVQSILDNAWHPSQTLGDDTPPATVSVTISRDGTVRGHITKHSGNSGMDRSVQSVLDTVTSVEPFPEGLKGQQVTANFTFDIKAKR